MYKSSSKKLYILLVLLFLFISVRAEEVNNDEKNLSYIEKFNSCVIDYCSQKDFCHVTFDKIKDCLITKPVIELRNGDNISIYVGDEYIDEGYSASDYAYRDISSLVNVDGSVNNKKVGKYTLTYSVSDEIGNTTSIEKIINVKEKTILKNCGEKGVIYLTFDDGPSSKYTPVILDVLKKYNVKATFFVTGNGPDELIEREEDEGHKIGLHSYTHRYDKIYTSTTAFWKDIDKVQNRVKSITGKKSNLIRFPGGSSNTVSRNYKKGIMSTLAKEVLNKDYQYFDWNISSGDAGGTTDPEVEYNNVIKRLSKKRGNVILMHDIKKHTSIAIENIVKYGLDNNYKFKVLSDNIICHHGINN